MRASLRNVRALHSSATLNAPKAATQGFKKGNEGKKQRKTAGSFRAFQDHVHAGQYAKKAPVISLPILTQNAEVNSVVEYSGLQKQRLFQIGAFKKDQYHELFASPISLVREETKLMGELVSKALNSTSKENRVCLLGERGIGKSTLLAQAQALAMVNTEAVIIPISYALKLVDGTSDFLFDAKLGEYSQPKLLKKLLDKIEAANKTSLAKLKLSKEYTIEAIAKTRAAAKFSSEQNLLDLVRAKVESRQRGQVFAILIEELLSQSQAPVFVTVDNFGSLLTSAESAYRNVSNSPVRLEELQITKTLFDLTSGRKSFKKGGVILATSSDDKPSLTLKAGLGLTKPDPYTKRSVYDPELASQIAGVKPVELNRLSQTSVSQLVQQYAQAGVLRKDELEDNSLERLAQQKYVVSGNGNPLELIRSVAMRL